MSIGTTTKGPLDVAEGTGEETTDGSEGDVGAGVDAGGVLGSAGGAEDVEGEAEGEVEGASEVAAGRCVG